MLPPARCHLRPGGRRACRGRRCDPPRRLTRGGHAFRRRHPVWSRPGVAYFYIILGVFLALGLGVFFVAMRGGPRGARNALHVESKATQRALTGVIVVVCAFGLVVPALVLAFNGAHKASVGVGDVHLNASQQKGRELFSHACNLCHTLSGAAAVGRTGPNLDVLIPTVGGTLPEKEAYADRRAFVLAAILEGRARGKGQMPALLYQGREAEDVAAFVAAVAGR
jgi:mono/diheme cytochrome c family protein